MDKELLRIAIIGTGLIIMLAMIISGYLKDKQAREDDDDYYDDDDEFEDDDEFDDDAESVKKPSLMQMLNNAYSQKVQKHQKNQKTTSHIEEDEDEIEPEIEHHEHHEESSRPAVAPSIIQFSVITKGNDDFNVADVFDVLEGLGLEYGSIQIFERLDAQRMVQFGVASMVEPGTFPDEDLEDYYCPGVVFFMQIDDLANPQVVFDDYVNTAVAFAHEMDGVVLDHRRQPLTDEMVNAIRNNL